MGVTKLDALQMAIKCEKEALDREIRENEARFRVLSEGSPLYAFTYGELTVQKQIRGVLERWLT